MALEKARVQLLDPNTGAVIAEVDVLTSAPVVAYVNDNRTVRDFRGIPAGTSFTEESETSVQDILDDILFPYTAPEISFITDHEGSKVTSDKTIYIERFKEVRPFFINASIVAGDKTDLTITLKTYNKQTGTTTSQDTKIKVTPGSTYKYQQKVEKFSFDTKLQIVVSDGKSSVKSALLSYNFIYPVFVGYCDLEEILSPDGVIIDDAKASNYFNTLIRNNSPLIEKRLCPIQNIIGMNVDNVLYENTKLHPCIVYPNIWNKVLSITDANEDDITGSFMYNGMVPIKPDPTVTSNVQYSVFANRNEYLVQLAAVGEISYNFESGRGSLDHIEEGVPSLTGFDVLCKLPADLRTIVDSFDDLYKIKYPYESLIVFVKEEKTFFKYLGDDAEIKWEPTNQQIFLTVTGEAPDIKTGQWNDIVIDIKSGIFYRKYKNVRWEEIGRFTAGGGYVDKWKPGTYQPGTIVYHNNKYYKAKVETSSEPGTDDTWEETTVGGGVPGPAGPPGDAATVVVVDTVTGEPGTEAIVENLGDQNNARLKFTIPRGDKGDQGEVLDVDHTLSVEGAPACAGHVGKALDKKVNLPIGQDGQVIVPKKGQILYANGDGTYSWVSLESKINEMINKLINIGNQME
jgi:hypothetical protein